MTVARDKNGKPIFLSSIVIYNNKYYKVIYSEKDLSFVLEDSQGNVIYNNFNRQCEKTNYKTLDDCKTLKLTETELYYNNMFESFTSMVDETIIKELNNASSI